MEFYFLTLTVAFKWFQDFCQAWIIYTAKYTNIEPRLKKKKKCHVTFSHDEEGMAAAIWHERQTALESLCVSLARSVNCASFLLLDRWIGGGLLTENTVVQLDWSGGAKKKKKRGIWGQREVGKWSSMWWWFVEVGRWVLRGGEACACFGVVEGGWMRHLLKGDIAGGPVFFFSLCRSSLFTGTGKPSRGEQGSEKKCFEKIRKKDSAC